MFLLPSLFGLLAAALYGSTLFSLSCAYICCVFISHSLCIFTSYLYCHHSSCSFLSYCWFRCDLIVMILKYITHFIYEREKCNAPNRWKFNQINTNQTTNTHGEQQQHRNRKHTQTIQATALTTQIVHHNRRIDTANSMGYDDVLCLMC